MGWFVSRCEMQEESKIINSATQPSSHLFSRMANMARLRQSEEIRAAHEPSKDYDAVCDERSRWLGL